MENDKLLKRDTVSMKIISALLPWIQWMNMYVFVRGVSIGYAIIVAIDIYYFFFINRASLNLHVKYKPHMWMFSFMLMYTMFLPIGLLATHTFNFVSIANRLVKLFFLYFLIFVTTKENLNWKIYKKSLEILIAIACTVIVYQFVSHSLTGSFYDVRIPFFEYYHETVNEKLSGASEATRFRSIFTEPAYFVYFIFQYFPIVLFENEDEYGSVIKRILVAGLLTICVVLSVSSTGLFLLVVVWLAYIIFLIKKGKITLTGFVIFVLAIIGSIVLLRFYLNSEILMFSSYRMSDSYEQSTVVWWRLEAGFEDIRKMSFVQTFFGYGMGNFLNENFMNGISYTILSCGYIGLFFVIRWILSGFKNSTACGKVATVVWILLIITEIMALYAPPILGYAIMINHFQKEKQKGSDAVRSIAGKGVIYG